MPPVETLYHTMAGLTSAEVSAAMASQATAVKLDSTEPIAPIAGSQRGSNARARRARGEALRDGLGDWEAAQVEREGEPGPE